MHLKNIVFLPKILFTVSLLLLVHDSAVAFSPKIHATTSSIAKPSASPNHPFSPNLHELSADDGRGPLSTAPSTVTSKLDWNAMARYPIAMTVQMIFIYSVLAALDAITARFSLKIPIYWNGIFLYAFNLKTSFFSILPNKRNDQRKLKQEDWEYNKRIKPKWTPPGIVFGIMWPLFTFGLRAASAAMIVKSSGEKFATFALMSLMLHLSFGNLWNSVNNVEKRLGVSTSVIYGLWFSNAIAAWQFHRVNPLAGKLLALTQIWITAAVALETRTWQINPDPETGKREPLLPRKHPKWETKFRWELQ